MTDVVALVKKSEKPFEHGIDMLSQHISSSETDTKEKTLKQRLLKAALDYLKGMGITWFTPEVVGYDVVIDAPMSGDKILVCSYNPTYNRIEYDPNW